MSFSDNILSAIYSRPVSSVLLKRILFLFPFTPSGALLFVVSVVLFGKSYASNNPYGLLLSIFSLIGLVILVVVGRLQARDFRRVQVQWEHSRHMYAGKDEAEQRIRIEGMKILRFYRLHFTIKGKMNVGRDAHLYISRVAAVSDGKDIRVPLYFPCAGELQARGFLNIRDIFGLTRARLGTEYIRSLVVQPARFGSSKSYSIEALGGFEEKNRQKSSDEERYYMREYIPGDRSRDINWKSSSRLAQLITKISPYTQEKMKIITVDFRNYRAPGRESVESVVHLNVLKSWLLVFLRIVKNENPDYQFHIRTGCGAFTLDTQEDIDRFSMEISVLHFQPEPTGVHHDQPSNELFIFSTPYDEDLPRVLAGYQKARVHLFRTVMRERSGDVVRTVVLFKSLRSMPFPGPWVLNRDRMIPATGFVAQTEFVVQKRGMMEEYPIAVKLLSSWEDR
jgi:hypothetical protein